MRPAAETGTQVLVVGAGPVGLLLAGDLSRYGVRVVLADRLPSPMTESRASQLTARTMELLDQRGLAESFEWLAHEPRGHFGGLPFDAAAAESCYAGNWKVPQYRTEAVLSEWARSLGVELRRGHELKKLDVDGSGVTAQFETPAGPSTVRAGHLVGCDGGGSTVAGLAGFTHGGAPGVRELLRADVRGVTVGEHRFARFETGFASSARRPDGVTRVMVHRFGAIPRDRTGPPEFGEIVRAWHTVTGEDLSGAEPLWLDAFDDSWALATEYRRGRVMLAGDAAHTHMPVGGQALNLGLRDAANLSWKLAAHLTGRAPRAVLDSYHTEQHAAAERVLANVQAQGMLLFDGPELDPLRELLTGMLARPGLHPAFGHLVSGLGERFEVGAEGHRLLGARMPDLGLLTRAGDARVLPLLHDARGVLLELAEGSAAAAERRRTVQSVSGWAECLRIVEARPQDPDAGSRLDGADAFLLRPDGHVVWTDTADLPLHTCVERWFAGK
ncbi:FAD-dependent monooxygenase [Streptomyces sp. 891-h]|uniref:FAD-dependent monooxygenase n=1 Tax=unclassified Streptomyces TaxID=2593676 RepID=UPI001FAA8FC5|nr:FAD-dependent monooxygenase [Streptomyces sp. 891-h]UNZ20469.1 NAD-binding protein [Streptomyces sp. 891-h]